MAEPIQATAALTQSEIEQYKVLLLNDDYTPIEFVVRVLERFFNQGPRRCRAHHAGRTPHGSWYLWPLHSRGGRGQSRPGDGLLTPASSSSAMHDGKRVSNAGVSIRQAGTTSWPLLTMRRATDSCSSITSLTDMGHLDMADDIQELDVRSPPFGGWN